MEPTQKRLKVKKQNKIILEDQPLILGDTKRFIYAEIQKAIQNRQNQVSIDWSVIESEERYESLVDWLVRYHNLQTNKINNQLVISL